MNIRNYKLYQIHAEFCRALANPTRLHILTLLKEGERSVGDLADEVGVSMATVSQHLAILRHKNVVERRREGQTIFYRMADPRLNQACETIRSVLLDGMKKRGDIANLIDIEEKSGE